MADASIRRRRLGDKHQSAVYRRPPHVEASVLYLDAKENLMRFWKFRLALASAAAAGLAAVVALLVPRSVVDGLLLIIIVAIVVGTYFLRRYARIELLYNRHAERECPAPRTEPESVNQRSAPDRPLGSPPAHPAEQDHVMAGEGTTPHCGYAT